MIHRQRHIFQIGCRGRVPQLRSAGWDNGLIRLHNEPYAIFRSQISGCWSWNWNGGLERGVESETHNQRHQCESESK